MRFDRIWLCLVLVGIPTIVPLPVSGASSASEPYWNADGNFALSFRAPYIIRAENSSTYYAPWGTSGWGIFAFGNFANETRVSADGYTFNVSQGIAHAWVTENQRIVNPRSGVVGFWQGIGGTADGFTPTPIGILGKDTILAYKIRRENTGVSQSLSSAGEDGILFDLLLVAQYNMNGTILARTLVIDFYVNQECGPLLNGCSQTNDTTVNHTIVGHTHFFGWRIHENFNDGVWISDIVNLRWYLENSVHRAFCWEATRSDSCNLPPVDASLYGMTATAEAFGGSAGFALAYEYLLQANDCGMGQDAGNDFSHASRINNLTSGAVLKINGWLGSGNLYKDTDDFYRVNVSSSQISGGYGVYVQTQSGFPIQLYASGDLPALRASADGNRSLFIRYNFMTNDPSGDWYLRVYGVKFGAYSLNISLYQPPNTPTRMPIAAICSPVSPAPPISPAPYVLIGSLSVLAAGVILGGRYGSRRWKHLN